jgi:glycosyltransferase involved in cell wall biosynthesis
MPRILHIGTNWNKNLHNVISALKDVNCVLRIIGKLSEIDKKILTENNIKYSQSENLSSLEIINEYKVCDIVSFPSIYEGFGMPIIEGQAIGRVVLTSNIDPLMEVGGDGSAYYVNPKDINEIKKGFIELINNDNLRDVLIEKGINNCKRFDLGKIVNQYMDVYLSVTNS